MRLFECSVRLFLLTSFHFLLFFLLHVTFVTYFILLKGGMVSCFNSFFDCSRGRGCGLIFFINFLLLLRGQGGLGG